MHLPGPDELRSRWAALRQEVAERSRVGKKLKGRLDHLLQECVEAGRYTKGVAHRESLQWLARDIADVIFGLTKEYPPAAIFPATSDAPVPQPTFKDQETERLSTRLEELYARREQLTFDTEDTRALDGEILDVRRLLRKGPQLQPGEFLLDGRFRLVEPLGQGGFAVVWKAYDRQLRRVVAVKILHGQHSEDRTRRERFFRGARKMAELTHPNIVRVLEKEVEESGWFFFVMEFVAGGDFNRAVLAGELTDAEKLTIVSQVGMALEFAHKRGVIHRDVKPANIVLDEDRRPKLTDFDLVLAADSTGFTQTQAMLGTLNYAAPEALESPKDAGPAADVYSLASTAIFALLGGPLPRGYYRDPGSTIASLGYPSALKRVLTRATAADPKQRCPSAGVFVSAVEEATAIEPLSVSSSSSAAHRLDQTPTDPRKLFEVRPEGVETQAGAAVAKRKLRSFAQEVRQISRRLLLAVTALAIAMALVLGIPWYQELAQRAQARGHVLATMDHAKRSPDRLEAVLLASELAWLPEPKGGVFKLRRLAANPIPTAVLRGHTDSVRNAVFSPDSSRVLTASIDGTARIWNGDGTGEPIVLSGHTNEVTRAVFSPDGSRVLTASDDDTARIWNSDGTGEPIVLSGHRGDVNRAVFSPDGSRVLTASDDDTARIWNGDGTGEPIVLSGHRGDVNRAVFSPDGSRVLTASDDGTARIWNIEGSGEPIVLSGHTDWVRSAVFSPDGSRVLTASDDGTARIWNANGTGEPIVLSGTGRAGIAVYSPDSSRVLTAFGETARIQNADGTGEPIVLSGHAGSVRIAVFSPDGSRVLTASNDGTARIWNVDGTGEPIVLSGHAGSVWGAVFSPDGSRVLTSSDDGTARIWPAVWSGLEPDLDWADAITWLRTSTTVCLTIEQRKRLLGESEIEAKSRYVFCERRFGRVAKSE